MHSLSFDSGVERPTQRQSKTMERQDILRLYLKPPLKRQAGKLARAAACYFFQEVAKVSIVHLNYLPDTRC